MQTTTKVRLKVADYHSLPERAGQAVTVNGENIVLFRISNGDVKAVDVKTAALTEKAGPLLMPS